MYGSIIFMGNKPVDTSEFLDRFKKKYNKWEDFEIYRTVYNQRTSPLETTWKMNCKTLNYAIGDNARNAVMKYVISAPTGSAKTENLITYCSMLPENITALISTNLTTEADRIAKQINIEVNQIADEIYLKGFINGKAYLPKKNTQVRAYSYHSKIPKETKLKVDEVANFQIIVTTHAFYKNNYSGSDLWSKLGENRDLLVIDEALETMKEYSVKDDSIGRAIRIFEAIKKNNKFTNDKEFEKELELLRAEFKLLESSIDGTNLLYTDTTTGEGLEKKLSNSVDKYKLFLEILGQLDTSDKTILNYIKKVNLNYIITGINDKSNNEKFMKELLNTVDSLNVMSKIGQVYITAHQGHNSFHRVTDMMFKKSLVCFDATAEINEIYKMRAKYYDDLCLIPKTNGLRDYSNVTLHSTINRTGRDAIDKDLVATVLSSIKFGNKTLIVTHKEHMSLFQLQLASLYAEHTVDIVNWGAITGLNNWKDFDTCVIVGLNHKSIAYSQNRVIVNTDTEETAFGDEQENLSDSIGTSMILAEIIQAMNRIRIRKIIDLEGTCLPANIYILLPKRQEMIYKNQILGQMPNINLKEWNGKFTKAEEAPSNFKILVEFLNNRLKDGETILKKDLLKELGMKPNSFATLQGKTDAKKQAFKENLLKAGIGIKEVMNKGGIIPRQYFYNIEQY